jgi:hypothetical protein
MDARLQSRLSKLLERSKDERGTSEVERMVAAEMLQRLLTQHNLDMADLESKGHQAKPGVKEEGHDLGKAAFTWKLNLAEAIAEHYFCIALVNRHAKTVTFVGRPDNVESLKMLYAWVIEQIKQLSAETRKAHHESSGEHVDPLRWQVNFGIGAVSRLRRRLIELKAKQAAEVTTTALVRSHEREISDYLEEQYGYRRDGQMTKAEREAQEAYEQRQREWRERMDRLKEIDPDAYFDMTGDPVTPAHHKIVEEREKQAEKDAERWAKQQERNARRRKGPAYREWSEERERKEEQASTARYKGRDSADRINLQPFVGEGKQQKPKGALR